MQRFKALTEKPWLANASASVPLPEVNDSSYLYQQRIANTALKFLIAVISVVFFLFTITFLQRSQSYDFQALAGEPWLPFTDLTMLWQNTIFLLVSSILLAYSQRLAQKNHIKTLVLSLAGTTLFTLLFIFGQINVWQELNFSGYFIHSNPANSYFYLLTGVHLLHLVGGVIMLTWVIYTFSKNLHQEKIIAHIQLCARYWHFLLGIWLFLFFLLTRTTQTYKTIALLCGF
ncbi:MAG: cytochrome c oxidase subunit 3 [Cognaticolwellia sp.]|jgi:cytochrome c oxidase subunit 3